MLKMILHFKLTMQVTSIEVFGSENMEEYITKTYVVQRVLSTQVDTSEKLQRHNLFQIFFIIRDCRVCTIID
jgi:hypothetical protein